MKKRIAAAALAAVLVCGIIGLRPKASGAAAGAIIGIGVLAFNLLGVMTGQYDDVAEGIGCFIDNGVEGWQKAFVGTESTPSWFVSGWQQIYNQCSSWFESGEITADGDKFTMSYAQYLELCDLVGKKAGHLEIDLGTNISYKVFLYDHTTPLRLAGAPNTSAFYNTYDSASANGCTYLPIYYNDSEIYFSSWYFNINVYALENIAPDRYHYRGANYIRLYQINNANFATSLKFSNSNSAFGDSASSIMMDKDFSIYFDYNVSPCYYFGRGYNLTETYGYKYNDMWFKYDSDTGKFETLTNSTLNKVDLSAGYVACDGPGENLIRDIKRFSATVVSDIDDLSDYLPLDKTRNPTLVIDTDPSIAHPDDAVLVTDVPGNPDMTLEEYKANTRLDIDIPSLICTKFPFCIPYDMIRILGVFCADPKAPVFRIPISTDPSQLEPFRGNQTIGDIPDDFEPMFEIDEELVIDLSVIPLVQPICYTVFIVGFVLLLIHITPKMINH